MVCSKPSAGCSVHAGTPGIIPSFFSTGNIENSGWRSKKRLILPSFSVGANVQVEYTSRPPGFNISAAQSKISACLAAQFSTFSGLHSSQASSFLRNIPSPEHGASTKMRSKYSRKLSESFCGVSFVTSALHTPMRSMFSDRIFALAGWISLQTISPSPCMEHAICVLLPPGAAHRSKMRSPGSAIRYSAGAIALGSWI